MTETADSPDAAASAPEEPAPSSSTIGSPNDAVRVLNFAGGAFDTVFQLGVVHALLVSQGKAPDAVVGVSSGAIHAVALAEVMQAGEELEQEKPSKKEEEIHRRRAEARVARFRDLLAQLYDAPHDLVDALLPDAYQIDSHRPLEPVAAPVFLEGERARRLEAQANHSGLVRLYNDLLRLPVHFGTLVRVVRRILGISAAAEIRDPVGRWIVRCLELIRLWLLVGTRLYSIASLVRLLASPMLAPKPRTRGATAGELIFRFRALDRCRAAVGKHVAFAVILSIWATITFAVALAPYEATRLFAVDPVRAALIGYPVALVVLLTAVAVGRRALQEFERTDLSGLLRSTIEGIFALLVPLVSWSAAGFGLLVVVKAGSGLYADKRDSVWESLTDAWASVGRVLSSEQLGWVLMPVIVVAIAMGVALLKVTPGRRYLRKLLRYYEIEDSLFHPYALERFFSAAFDLRYFGQTDMSAVVERSLDDDVEPSKPLWTARGTSPDGRKYVSWYSRPERRPAIHVGLGVANLDSGASEVVAEGVTVVDGLVAATAAIPLFPPKRLGDKVYIDGSHVANEPIHAMLTLLREPLDPARDRVHPKAKVVHVYSVTPVPVSRATLHGPRPEHNASPRLNLVEVLIEVARLRRFQDATLERRLTQLVTKVLPRSGCVSVAAGGRTYLRILVTPIEPEEPVDLNLRILRARREEARARIEETIADGCRAAMEVMVGPSVGGEPRELLCADALEKHFDSIVERERAKKRMRSLTELRLPGSQKDHGPGLEQICRRCSLRRAPPETTTGSAPAEPPRCTLSIRESAAEDVPWPHERARVREEVRVAPRPREEPTSSFTRKPRRGPVRDPGPKISLLFSGGVFRGVFQIGVVNALSELGVHPDLIAGASVGSITAAMTAGVLRGRELDDRRLVMGRLAAAYLTLDRLILSDRFADFIRTMTVRAADARFSLRQADRVFRKYDAPGAGRFDKEARIVVAGLERLLYVSPFELVDLVKAVRERRTHDVVDQLREMGREWLDRMGVGQEILGAELLQRLIKEHIVQEYRKAEIRRAGGQRADQGLESDQSVTFGAFQRSYDLEFLATTTNLTKGGLEIIGGSPKTADPQLDARLDEGLLASSAFPGVFRPRDSLELFARPSGHHQYVDGGIMDNLPLDAAAEFWHEAARAKQIEARPEVPHLILSASLEPRVHATESVRRGQRYRWLESWPELRNRAKQLGYNRKVDRYAGTQRAVRELYRLNLKPDLTPLDLEVVVVKPLWLCGTFAFHPMLGFRRRNQARSIAHGCASTFLELGRIAQDEARKDYLPGWDVDAAELPKASSLDLAMDRWREDGGDAEHGACWLRPERVCPFSAAALQPLGLLPATKRELSRIYRLCLEPKTHRSK